MQSVFAAVDTYATRPFVVGYRVSPEEFETPGIRLDDTLWLLAKLRESRLDYLHLSLNAYDRVARDFEHQAKPILAYVHEALQNQLPLIGVGGVRTRQDVTTVLDDAEMVAVGQQLIFDPTWATKLLQGADDAFLSVPFAKALSFVPLNTPLYDFLATRYHRD